MTKLLLSLHVLGAIVLIGPSTVAASLFPRYARQVLAPDGDRTPAGTSALRLLHRVTRVYAGVSIAVPLLGFVTAMKMGVLGDAWLIASIALTVVAAVLLAFAVFSQDAVIDALDAPDRTPAEVTALSSTLPRLAMVTGLFSLTWAVVTVLMIIRPGSTTGA
ncbi:DUF2269 family protein [Streptomyces caatingaensis]|uniref:Membrane protein n=1 Tax=Streptomyces caatingaensis TaxID=1678637 RepID=A0A0K9X8Y4_9ACTN|nr:membrane protein [Streptomyces caatingaensis]KNB49889.1 membrane protein [Streptomyces caatingaensis]